MDLSFVELWHATGPLARAVVLLLAAMSVATGALAADKLLRLRRAERATTAFLAPWPSTPPAALPELIARHGDSPAARLVEAVARALAGAPAGAAREIHDHAVRRHLLATATDLRRGLSLLATVGSTAPFIGLFGTVVGIINAFHAIAAAGSGGMAVVSGGIAEALVATGLGIFVAIPAVVSFNHFTGKLETVQVEMNRASSQLVNCLFKIPEVMVQEQVKTPMAKAAVAHAR